MDLFGKKGSVEIEKRPDDLDRLPPGQYLTGKQILSQRYQPDNCR